MVRRKETVKECVIGKERATVRKKGHDQIGKKRRPGENQEVGKRRRRGFMRRDEKETKRIRC